MSAPPIPCAFVEGVFRPVGGFAKVARQHYGEGEIVPLIPHEERSSATHRHFFASVNECWRSLPEDLAERFPTSDHLRKFCLIKTGYHDQQSLVCSSRAEAIRLAAFLRPIDDYAVVTVSEAVVTRYTAKSQSQAAMGKADFAASKEAVLALLSEMLGVPVASIPKTEAA